jgi:hypothetical protein
MAGFHGFHFFVFAVCSAFSLHTPLLPSSIRSTPLSHLRDAYKAHPNGKTCLVQLFLLTFHISAPAGDRRGGSQTMGVDVALVARFRSILCFLFLYP